jgi:hypothetical protein
MANANSIYGAKLAAPLANPTAASVFLTQDSVTANAASSSLPTKAAVVYLPEVEVDAVNLGNNAGVKWPLGTSVWSVRLVGRAATGTSGTFTVALQIGNSTTAGTNTTITASALVGTFNLLGNYEFQFNLSYDPTSKLLAGNAGGWSGTTGTAVAGAAITPVTVDLSLGKQALCVTGIFGTSNVNNIGYLDAFTLEVVG